MIAKNKFLLLQILVLKLFSLILSVEVSLADKINPLVYDRNQIENTQKIAVFIPGAFSSIDIFRRAAYWEERGYALVYYRLPGLDGLPLSSNLRIKDAASTIATLVNSYSNRKVALVGYSTGGPIALETAVLLKNHASISVAAISSAVRNGGGIATLTKGARDISSAALRTKSIDRNVYWERYWQTLAYGPKAIRDKNFSSRIKQLAKNNEIVIPSNEMVRSHTRDLTFWVPSDRIKNSRARIGFFLGLEDPVFSLMQTNTLAKKVGSKHIITYREDGHLLPLTQPKLFKDILSFIEK